MRINPDKIKVKIKVHLFKHRPNRRGLPAVSRWDGANSYCARPTLGELARTAVLYPCYTSLCNLTAALQQEGRETADQLQEPAGVLHSNHCGQCVCNCGLCSAWELCFQMLDPANPVPDAARLFAAQTLCYKVGISIHCLKHC